MRQAWSTCGGRLVNVDGPRSALAVAATLETPPGSGRRRRDQPDRRGPPRRRRAHRGPLACRTGPGSGAAAGPACAPAPGGAALPARGSGTPPACEPAGRSRSTMLCAHQPPCPAFAASDRLAAHVLAAHPEQGWSLLCNGVVVFDDLDAGRPGVLRPLPRRTTAPTRCLAVRHAARGRRCAAPTLAA